MDARHPQHANGHRTRFMPQGPDSIIFTLGRHEEAIDHLHTRITSLELAAQKEKGGLPPVPWREVVKGIWGLILLVALVLVATGKITSQEAMTILGRG